MGKFIILYLRDSSASNNTGKTSIGRERGMEGGKADHLFRRHSSSHVIGQQSVSWHSNSCFLIGHLARWSGTCRILLPFGVYHKTMQANIGGAMKHAPVNSGAASRSYWSLSLLRVIPSFHVGNKVAPFDVQDLPNASWDKDNVTLLFLAWFEIQC